MPAHRMSRDEFHAKLAGYGADQHGFAMFVDRAAPQLLRWETGHGWTRYGFGGVAEKESSVADVLEAMLQAPDHWRAFAVRYLEVLDEAADRTPASSPVAIDGR